MATYIYETIPKKKGERAKRYEIQQSMTEDALTKHPDTGEAIQRVITGGFGYLKRKGDGSSDQFDDFGHDHDHDHHH